MFTLRADAITASGPTLDKDQRDSVFSRVAEPSVSAPLGSVPMDLRVTERVMRPGSDTALHPPLLHSPFSHQPCTTFSQHQLHQHIRFNMEQRRREQEQEKQQELQQLWHKDKSQQSAVASSLVKQKLQEVILKKQKQQALGRTSSNPLSGPPVGYRELAPDPSGTSQPLVSPPPQGCREGSDDTPLRRAASEPNLKVKHKLKKHLNTRKSPLTRKESAPSPIKHRVPDTLDSSPSSSSTPVSGCSSPNDSLPNENGVLPSVDGLSHEVIIRLAQRLLLQDGSLAHFTVQSSSALPTITLGLPANARSELDLSPRKVGRVPMVTGGQSVYLPLGMEEQSGSLSPHLQPVLLLEPSRLVHTPMLAVPGLGTVPLQFAPQMDRLAPGGGPHKALSRTRSEPLPQSLRSLHPLLQQHHNSQLLERLKQQTHLGKLMSKSSEKPRLRQIPSEDMDSEEVGPTPSDTYHGRARVESLREAEPVSDLDSQGEQINLQHTLILNQSLLWEKQKQLQQLRRQTAHMETLAVPMMLGSAHRPLFRTQSSPASTSLTLPDKPLPIPAPEPHSKPRFTTGLVYDSQMLKHQCTCGDNSSHPEHAGRIQSIWSRLQERGLRGQCETIRGRKATLEELQSVHSERHVLLYGTNPLNRLKLDNRKLAGILSQRMFVMLPCGGVGVDNDTIWNESHTSTASRMAAGSVTELAFRVAKGELKNGFAVVRPPGHHADPSNPMGFCYFNSVAIAAKQLQQKLSANKILIVDWDVHHGNGTQEVFYNDPSVLYISLHRYDDGNFFPGSGGPAEVGSGAGEGFNVNVAWTGGLDPPMSDAEYIAAFRTVVMPIAQEFSPDVILVSSGFDAAEGHPAPLGGYKVTGKCFGFLTRQLMGLAGGRVIMALEGGHDLTAICDASEACVSALLGIEEPLSEEVLLQKPNANSVCSLQRVIQIHGQYWQSLKTFSSSVGLSFLGAQRRDCEETDAVNALASLSVGVLTSKSLPDEPMEHDDNSM
ncbi:histone deacetylase 7 isoform X1 [Oncorhynchus mykiss]|uniref:histone deacetylase 7 isoform X1 n=2 Tax=Oncorhynchus mykiss TaxID=8022 RepID=UPI00187863C3|nr:histone deacetylase 7 isoform X1 [Oncorhynchus mykiss]